MPGRFEELISTIRTLRAPGGCPWDRKQTLLSAARYLMDEAGELVEAALAEDDDGCREELADLLFMVSFCTEILGERVPVTLHDIASEGTAKLVRRHPHVFGDAEAREIGTSQELWNAAKAEEKRAKGLDPDQASALKDLPAATAPLHQAHRYQKNAAEVGFDWPAIDGVWDKLREELAEVTEAAADGDPVAIEHEIGDLLFSVVNLSRWLKTEPDMALRRANGRFRARFHLVEQEYRDRDEALGDASLAEMESAWQRAKARLSGRT